MKLRHFAAATICAGFVMMMNSAMAEPVRPMRLEAQAGVNSATQKAVEIPAQTAAKPPIDKSAQVEPSAVVPEILPDPVRVIVIDPGHGGTNEGAVGVAKIHEKHLTLQVALLLADRLRKRMPDVQIVLTRQRDQAMSLAERIEIANRIHADLFISLHFNSSNNPDAIGFESFHVGSFWESDMIRDGVEITDEIRAQREKANALSERFAQSFNRAMRHRFSVLDRGVKPGDYTVLTRAEVPSVVLEMAFLSHAQEGISLVSSQHRAKLVDALEDAVIYYSSHTTANSESTETE